MNLAAEYDYYDSRTAVWIQRLEETRCLGNALPAVASLYPGASSLSAALMPAAIDSAAFSRSVSAIQRYGSSGAPKRTVKRRRRGMRRDAGNAANVPSI